MIRTSSILLGDLSCGAFHLCRAYSYTCICIFVSYDILDVLNVLDIRIDIDIEIDIDIDIYRHWRN